MKRITKAAIVSGGLALTAFVSYNISRCPVPFGEWQASHKQRPAEYQLSEDEKAVIYGMVSRDLRRDNPLCCVYETLKCKYQEVKEFIAGNEEKCCKTDSIDTLVAPKK